MNPSYSPGGTNVHSFGPTSCLVNGIATDSVVFAKVTGVPNTQTNMNTDHRRCNTCSNSMHLSDVCTMQSCLILIIIISYDSYTSDGGLLIFLLCFVTPLQVAQLNIYNAAVQCLHLWLGRGLWNVFHKQQSPIQRVWNKITTGSRCLINQMSLNNHLPGEPGPAHLASCTPLSHVQKQNLWKITEMSFFLTNWMFFWPTVPSLFISVKALRKQKALILSVAWHHTFFIHCECWNPTKIFDYGRLAHTLVQLNLW